MRNRAEPLSISPRVEPDPEQPDTDEPQSDEPDTLELPGEPARWRGRPRSHARAWIRALAEPRLARLRANTLPAVVVIEDDGDIVHGLELALSGAYEVATARCGSTALQLLGSTPADVLLIDFRLPDTNGIALISELRQRGTTCPAIMISAYANQREASLAAGFGGFILKPWANGQLVWHIENALANPG